MRFLISASMLAFCTLHSSNVKASDSDESQSNDISKTFTRSVELPDIDGSTIKVTQVLKRFPDGSLEYDPSTQPAATREYDARQCAEGSAPGKGLGVWGPDTLHGGACFQTFDSVEELESWNHSHPTTESKAMD